MGEIKSYTNDLVILRDTTPTIEGYKRPELKPIEPFDVRRTIGIEFRKTVEVVPVEATPWQERQACKGTDPSIFFPEDDDDPADEAKAICAQCSVSDECLEDAIARGEKIGVFGGYTGKERRRLVRNRKEQARNILRYLNLPA